MKFEILSHAGLAVTHANKTLVCDPWLVGSTHWRSWWNYPPVVPNLLSRLSPDVIYLTHIHWDHFQGVSLRKFPRDTQIVIPRAPGPQARERSPKLCARVDVLKSLVRNFTVTVLARMPFRRSRAAARSAR